MKITPSWFEVAVASGVSNTETWGYFGANISVGAKTLGVWQGSFTVVNLHDLWSSYPVVHGTL